MSEMLKIKIGEEVVDVPKSVIFFASEQAWGEDAKQIVGLHPVFGWVSRHIEDEGSIAELTNTFQVDASGNLEGAEYVEE